MTSAISRRRSVGQPGAVESAERLPGDEDLAVGRTVEPGQQCRSVVLPLPERPTTRREDAALEAAA